VASKVASKGLNMSKRSLAVIAALVLAALAALSLTSYVRGVAAKAKEAQEPVPTFVAKDTIPAGRLAEDVIREGLITQVDFPRERVVAGAITSLRDISGKVTSTDIMKGEQILAARFAQPAEARGILPIPADRQALAVEVGIPPGVAGFIQPGDRVSIVALLDVPKGDKTEPKAQYLLQDVGVLAVGKRNVSTETKDKEGSKVVQSEDRVLMTLALTPEQAEKVVFSIFKGQVYFTLLPPGQKPVGTPGRTIDNVLK
jgi:pilus assembly protein CpaB